MKQFKFAIMVVVPDQGTCEVTLPNQIKFEPEQHEPTCCAVLKRSIAANARAQTLFGRFKG